MPEGSWTRVRSTMVRTSSTAFCRSVPSSNSSVVLETPVVTVELTFLIPATPVSAFSIGRVIWFSISVGAAPLWVTETVTIGSWTLGNCLIGIRRNATDPDRVRMMNSRTTGIGLRIAQAEIFIW